LQAVQFFIFLTFFLPSMENLNPETFTQREFTRPLQNPAFNTLRLHCDNRLAEQAEWLMTMVEQFGSTEALEDGTTIELGFSILTLVADGTTLDVCEPDFDNEPFERVVDDVSRTLWVLLMQNEIIVSTGTAELAAVPRFDDTIILEKGVLEADHIYLERMSEDDDDDDDLEEDNDEDGEIRDSGWFCGIVGSDEGEDGDDEAQMENFEAKYIYELLKHRPTLLSVMSLPVGYAAVFEGDEVEEIFNDEGESIWTPHDEE
jgi:hypothetical protein